ncbi:MAG: biosynthetic-type acetolactate synthase large subunit [Spirochaetes bacterium]|nr:MAG: biosynthetic-type acetolactate synthase large subunit [Spirochaetota bacterium]
MKKGRSTGARSLVKTLEKMGVEVIFGYPGGANLPIYGALKGSSIKHILARHEQGAAHMADGYARVTGKVGVCLATSGPGATNLVTGIATAYMDSSPIVAITGQVPSTMIGNDAFQEVDITGITIPITKHNYLIQSAEEIGPSVKEAFYLADSGRKGPVLIDIPKDILSSDFIVSDEKEYNLEGYNPTIKGHPGQIKKAAAIIKEAEQPVIIAGGGVFHSDAFNALHDFVEKSGIPFVHSLMGKSSIDSNHPLNYGMYGYHGKVAANTAIVKADLIIAIGTRFGDRSTGPLATYARDAKIIHIDIDPAEISKNVSVFIPIVGNARDILPKLTELVSSKEISKWVTFLNQTAKEHPLRTGGKEISVPGALEVVKNVVEDAIIVTDVGRHQMFAALYSDVKAGRTFLTSGGLGTMGFGLPAAVGAKVGAQSLAENRPVVLIAGDGGFTMTCQEIVTAVEENLPLILVVLNDSSLGMIAQLQDEFYDGSFNISKLGDFVQFDKLAISMGAVGYRTETIAEFEKAVKEAADSGKTCVIDCIIKEDAHVYPMVKGSDLLDLVE